MKKFNEIFYSILVFSCLLFVTGCSTPEAEEEMMLNLESDLQTAHKDVNQSAKAKYYTADLSMLNNSGVSGTADLVLEGNELTVTIWASGVEAGEIHLQHIHGFAENNQNATCPPPSADGDDADNLVGFLEGKPFYGGVLLPLNPFPQPSDETFYFQETYTLEDASVTPLQNTTIVLHGMTVDGTYVTTLPVACGQIQPAQGNNR